MTVCISDMMRQGVPKVLTLVTGHGTLIKCLCLSIFTRRDPMRVLENAAAF